MMWTCIRSQGGENDSFVAVCWWSFSCQSYNKSHCLILYEYHFHMVSWSKLSWQFFNFGCCSELVLRLYFFCEKGYLNYWSIEIISFIFLLTMLLMERWVIFTISLIFCQHRLKNAHGIHVISITSLMLKLIWKPKFMILIPKSSMFDFNFSIDLLLTVHYLDG